ncbi:site-2 protease family protein [Pseudoduganella sp. GCM10020061]|uniref:site-2 protease family protein n=1 Tax=Pseudoduganella sp. GCM10020061 TaxID=3317345 RepID=UPI003634327A
MNYNEIIQAVAVYALPVIFAITLHEAAHAYAAKYFGDLTAYAQGRMSLNPIKHIDPLGTIVIPLVVLAMSQGQFFFGYAKPVPVNYSALRNPRKQMAYVALAGPASNFAMAFGWMVLGLLMIGAGVSEPFPLKVAQAGINANLLFFALNMLPIPPLDGGRIMTSILPPRYGNKFAMIEPYGFVILIALMLTHSLGYLIAPFHIAAGFALDMLATPITIFLN